ncbi:hypothetical protein RHECNPAF_2530030 [Rhizobium etli CNPAF512]|nr:hypothetical protein RHECNPAF_2530030 [Rhizobium etli CNPAF512]
MAARAAGSRCRTDGHPRTAEAPRNPSRPRSGNRAHETRAFHLGFRRAGHASPLRRAAPALAGRTAGDDDGQLRHDDQPDRPAGESRPRRAHPQSGRQAQRADRADRKGPCDRRRGGRRPCRQPAALDTQSNSRGQGRVRPAAQEIPVGFRIIRWRQAPCGRAPDAPCAWPRSRDPYRAGSACGKRASSSRNWRCRASAGGERDCPCRDAPATKESPSSSAHRAA